MLGVDYPALSNEIYLGCFRDSVVRKFYAFLSVYDDIECYKLSTYLLEVCNHALRDSRSPTEYGREVMRGWMVEDCVAATLRHMGLSVKMAGSDKDREFYDPSLTGIKPQTPDLLVEDRWVEVVCDWGNYWGYTDKIDLRLNKIDMLIGYQALLIGVAPNAHKVAVLDFAKMSKGDWTEGDVSGYDKRGYTFEGITKYMDDPSRKLSKLEMEL